MRRFNADFYIHERTEWPQFRYDLDALLKPLGIVRHRQGTLAGKMQGYGFDLNIEAHLEALTEEVQKSSEIEGERLDREQVRSSIAQRLHIDIGALAPVDGSVEGVVEMMLDATQHYDAPLTAERLFGWHTSLFASSPDTIRAIQIGQWRDDRTGPMQVVSGPMGRERVHYEAPPAERLEAEMRRFLDWFNAPDALDPVLKAGISHLWFVTIHPFDDGNGRMARAIADMQLARSEGTSLRAYSMSSQIRKERRVYYDLLEETQKGDLGDNRLDALVPGLSRPRLRRGRKRLPCCHCQSALLAELPGRLSSTSGSDGC